MNHTTRTALAMALSLAFAATSLKASAQEAGPVFDAIYDRDAQHAMPSIPIFFGDRYEGTLSPENGSIRQMHSLSFFKVEPRLFNVAYYDIDLYKDEYLNFGVVTDQQVYVSFYRQVTDKKGATSWKWMSAMGGFFGPKTRDCYGYSRSPDDGKYRVRITTVEPETVVPYKFFFLSKAHPAQSFCGDKREAHEAEFMAGPGKPASLQVAKSWEGRARLPAFGTQPTFTRPENPDAETFAQTKREELRPLYRTLYLDGEHNAVLNFERLGLAAMEIGAYDEAEWAFDEALRRIESFYGKTAVAKEARSKWTGEGIKDFKGEPYERVMAYYYRGLLYLREGDYQNARASFMAGEFQDTLSEAEEFQGDFALMNYLSGWSSYCMGDTVQAADAFAVAKQVNPGVQLPGKENTLLIADLGRGPVKMARGSENKLLTIVDSIDAGRDERASALVGNAAPLTLQEYSNIHFQATTRGGRAFDSILNGKAQLRNGLQGGAEIGYLLTQSGVPPLQLAGLAITLVSGGIGMKVKPDADVRAWDTLPNHVSLGLLNATPSQPVSYSFSSDGKPAIDATPVMRSHQGQCGIAWSRSRSALGAPLGAPGNDEDIVKARDKNKEAQKLDAAFRTALAQHGEAGAAAGAD
ncbi:hypothetical protein [Lysobacter niastensis]|uniref:Tetratricopeptide repeat protein n=1 Tax=Lysobacter niastensis TaxID=380629 RepID=A0ABS0B6D8_9GAMM|nr:hypothetical protein [Lysobacter niastensis]MBF6023224.1 hypothetical protein [Lysobacter niastensis]